MFDRKRAEACDRQKEQARCAINAETRARMIKKEGEKEYIV